MNMEIERPVHSSFDGSDGKRHYKKLTITKIEIGMEQCILAGSITKVIVEVGEVSVKSFEEDSDFVSGSGSDGFEASFD